MNDPQKPAAIGLKRTLGAPMLSIYGAGTIVGAGIYVLIGEVAGTAGYWTPLAFLIAALVAGVTGFVYAELASRTPGAGGPVAYSNAAFGIRWIAIVIGWAIVVTGLVSGATIISGFTGYLGFFVEVPRWLVITITALVLGGIAGAGVRQSAWFMAVTTTAGIAGLVFVIVAGAANISELPVRFAEAAPISDITTISAIMAAAFLAFYAFIGFEDLVHMREEARRPERDLPIAIIVALAVSAFLYIATSIAALLLVGPESLAGATAPLVEAVGAAGWPQWPLGLASLAIIINGALAQIIMSSRVLYSLGKRGGAPQWLAAPNARTGTPLVATGLVTVIIITLAGLVSLSSLAGATSLIMLAIFFISNLSLIVLDRRKSEAPFNVPRWLPWLGAALCVALVAGQFVI